jgi:hypothetical protein
MRRIVSGLLASMSLVSVMGAMVAAVAFSASGFLLEREPGRNE